MQSASQKSYIIKDDEPYWKSELNSQLSGLRINSTDTNYIDYGQIRHWIIGAEEKIVYCPSVLAKCNTDVDLSEEDQGKCEYCKNTDKP